MVPAHPPRLLPQGSGRMILARGVRIAIVDEELPFPAISGKRIRTLNLLLQLSRRHQITYICYRNADAEEAREGAVFLRDHGIETVLVDRATPRPSALRRDPGFYFGLARNILSPLPYLITSNDSRQLRQAVRQHAQTHAVDLWQCEWTPYVQALRELRSARVVVMAHNVESLIWQRYFEIETNLAKRWYIGHQWRKMQRFEARTFAGATRVITVSQEDATLVSQRFGRVHVDVVDNGVDTSYFRATGEAREPGRILFLGSLDWRPNLDAIRLLLEQIFPRVMAEEPRAKLSIVGRNPPPWLVRATAQSAGHVDLHANVPDVRPYLNRCGVLAVPLRIGGGSRLKILEALATATPVVSTPVGAEGLRLTAGEHYVEADTSEPMVQALIAAIRNPDSMAAMAQRGRQVVLENYDWSILARRLEAVWQDALANPTQVTTDQV